MNTVEKEAPREELRQRIIEAARDLVGEEGLDALSMRALAERIAHSPGTIYLHFRDKEELLRSVMQEGFTRLGQCMIAEIDKVGLAAPPMEQFAATGRGYARFAIENTGYFKAMFMVPAVASLEACPPPGEDGYSGGNERRDFLVELMRAGQEAGQVALADAERATVVAWGLVHGLTSLYVSGHLADQVTSHAEFMELIEGAMDALRTGWEPRS
jgi:AcrR family transcriptional regulator